MRIVHTSDWHLGKLFHGISLIEDQEYLLFEQLLPLLEEVDADVLVIAGDIYDRSNPPKEAVAMLGRFLDELKRRLPNIEIMMIAGNHDSPERIEFAKYLLGSSGVHTEGFPQLNPSPILLEDAHGPVAFYLIPFFYPEQVAEFVPTHDDEMEPLAVIVQYFKSIAQDARARGIRSVLVSHTMAGEQKWTESIVGEREIRFFLEEVVPVSVFKDFSYTALGHIHKPFPHPKDAARAGVSVRYSGALMTFDFSEVEDGTPPRGVWFVELNESGLSASEFIELVPKRRMYVLRDSLDKLLHSPEYEKFSPHYLQIEINSQYRPDFYTQLKKRFHNLVRTRWVAIRSDRTKESPYEVDITESTNPKSIFSQFWKFATNGNDMDRAMKLFEDILENIHNKEDV